MKTLYLCGGINGLSDVDAKGWREQATAALTERFAVRDPMARDYRRREAENVDAIVDGDLADIRACDVLLVNASRPSWGTAMEVYFAHSVGRYVVAFGAGPSPSPWLVRHSHFIAGDLNAAIDHARAWAEA